LAYNRIKHFDGIASYLARGRQKARTPPEKLKQRWVVLMHEWANDYAGFDTRELDDIQVELELRSIELPGDLVKDALSSLERSAQRAVDELENLDPENVLNLYAAFESGVYKALS
jgi:hypothetical protein